MASKLTAARREQNRVHAKKFRDKNKEKLRAWFKEYNQQPNRKKWVREWKKLQKPTIQQRIRNAVRARLGWALKHARVTKSNSTSRLLGCSYVELMTHLESQFKEGMTWENYGDWHIDHIRPCASFDLTDCEQQKQCCHYTNLQPMWAEENRKKSDKWTP